MAEPESKLYLYDPGTEIVFTTNIPDLSITAGDTGKIDSIQDDGTVIVSLASGAAIDIEPDQNIEFVVTLSRGTNIDRARKFSQTVQKVGNVMTNVTMKAFEAAERSKQNPDPIIEVGDPSSYQEMEYASEKPQDSTGASFEDLSDGGEEPEGMMDEEVSNEGESKKDIPEGFRPLSDIPVGHKYRDRFSITGIVVDRGADDIIVQTSQVDGTPVYSSKDPDTPVKYVGEASPAEFDDSEQQSIFQSEFGLNPQVPNVPIPGAPDLSHVSGNIKSIAKGSPGALRAGARFSLSELKKTPKRARTTADVLGAGAGAVGDIQESFLDAAEDVATLGRRKRYDERESLSRLQEKRLRRKLRSEDDDESVTRAEVDVLGQLRSQERINRGFRPRGRGRGRGGIAAPITQPGYQDDYDDDFGFGGGEGGIGDFAEDIGSIGDDFADIGSGFDIFGDGRPQRQLPQGRGTPQTPGSGISQSRLGRNRRLNFNSMTEEDIRELLSIWQQEDPGSFNDLYPKYPEVRTAFAVFRNNHRRIFNNVKDIFLTRRDTQGLGSL